MSRRGWLLFAAMCVIWGIPYLLIKVAVRAITPAELVFVRTAIGALLLVPIALSRGQLRPLLTRWRPFLIYSAVEIAVPWFLLSTAETQISSSLSGLLVAAVPLIGVVITMLVGGGDQLRGRHLVGLLLGLVGVAAVVGLDLGHVTVLALLEMLVVICCYALGPQILSRRLADLPSLGVVAGSVGICALVYLPVGIVERPASLPSGSVLLALLALGAVCTALAFILFFWLIAEVGPIRATVITYVNPAVAVALGVALLHEPLTVGIVVGFVLVLGGSILATRASARDTGAPGSASEATRLAPEPSRPG
ncbi:MAG: DMT family transporter [Candidatus Dormibacteria bacterium]